MKAPNGRLFSDDGSTQARRPGGILGLLPQIFFLLNFVVLRKICFKHIIKQKSFTPEMYFSPPNLKIWLLPKLCVQLRYFVLKAVRPRDR